MPSDDQWMHTDLQEDAPLWEILEGRNLKTGEEYFYSLVESLAVSLNVQAALVTELNEDWSRFKTLAFYDQGKFKENYTYQSKGSPCGDVVTRGELIHYPDRLLGLFPENPDLKGTSFKSFLGTPMTNLDGRIVGHLAILDSRPMPKEPKNLALFQLFAARAAAEYQRLHAEEKVRAREEKLGRLVDSALDVIIELDEQLVITLISTWKNTHSIRKSGSRKSPKERTQ